MNFDVLLRIYTASELQMYVFIVLLWLMLFSYLQNLNILLLFQQKRTLKIDLLK